MKMLALAAVAALALASASHAQQIVGIGTNPQGSLTYPVGAAIAKVLQEKAGIQARIMPSAGSSTNIPLVNRGELELSLMTVDDSEASFKGREDFEGKPNPNIRLLGAIFPMSVAMLVAKDAPYKTISDMKGARLPSEFPGHTGGRKITVAVLAASGMSYADVKPVPATNLFQATNMLGEGKVDGAVISIGAAVVQQAGLALSARGGVRYISVDSSPDAVARLKKHYPGGFIETFQPGPPGVVAPTQVCSFSQFVIASNKLSDDVVYRITKAIYENKEMLAGSAPPLRRFSPQNMAEANPVPYHPGAEKFYREVGMWPPKER
jgi:TRAP transporter TAXI family solute receptor